MDGLTSVHDCSFTNDTSQLFLIIDFFLLLNAYTTNRRCATYAYAVSLRDERCACRSRYAATWGLIY